jgi:hypothetical protein
MTLRDQYLKEMKLKNIDNREFAFNLSLGYVKWLEFCVETEREKNRQLSDLLKGK